MKHIRLTALALSGALTLTLLAGCGSKNAEPTPVPSETPIVSAEPSETPEVSTEPTETPAVSAEPSETPEAKPSEKPADKPSEKPSEKPADTPAPEAPAADKTQAVWDAISGDMELPVFMDLDDELLTSLFYVDPADLESYVAKVPMMNTQATEFFIAKVKSGSMDSVKSALTKHQGDLEEQWSQYLPAQLELVQNYKMVTNGDYIIFCVAQQADRAVELFSGVTAQ